MTSRIRVKMGPIEVEYEGSEIFLKYELLQFLGAISELYGSSGIWAPGTGVQDVSLTTPTEIGPASTGSEWSTATVAAKLDCTTGRDLVMAACARLAFGLGLGTFTRDQILGEMKAATAYYRENHRKNLTNYLRTLLKKSELVESAKGSYALSASARKRLEQQLASQRFAQGSTQPN